MRNNFNVRNFAIVAVICTLTLLFINSCKQEQYTQSTTDDVNITGYLDKYPDQFSLMTQIIKRSGTAGYLGAYGKFTLFTPTNEAITAWLKSNNKTGVDQLTVEEAKNMVKYHLLPDTVATNRFSDGKLAQITLYGQYLQTGVKNEAGVSSYIVNKLAKITQSNVRLGNGIVHVMDHVLIPASLSLAKSIEANPRYTYFTQAFKETGFYDSLNVDGATVIDTTRRFQTVILESDSALKAAGFATYASFKARYSKSGNPKLHSDSLWLYMAYHISTGPTYVPDIISTPAIYTLAPKEVITTKFAGQSVLLNEDEFAGVIEPGVEINRTYSDVTASNGVQHEVKKPFTIKVRVQAPVYWDVADQPELRANPKWRGAAAATIGLYPNNVPLLSGVIYNDLAKVTQGSNYDYVTVPNASRKYNSNDMLNMSVGSSTARLQWFELRTPMLVKGKYKVWICYAANTASVAFQVGFDIGRQNPQTLLNTVDFRQDLSSSGVTSSTAAATDADAKMLTNGFKRYMATTADTQGTLKGLNQINTTGWNLSVGRLAGVIDVQTTDRHWLRLTLLAGGGNTSTTWLDMIHFIPVDAEQGWPRFSTQGVVFQKP
ncbi:fasciclin domain-containing protein [Pedobacter frigiditerrae]|uniref:fasciclin domain-containing protein n=1 Tax=Pedobacter frigiditerrae TaxID=2530452 RepID=UPI0029312D6F|nr:fasciclin domain-containing protein [Pedobacter frigiditerrae]